MLIGPFFIADWLFFDGVEMKEIMLIELFFDGGIRNEGSFNNLKKKKEEKI